MLLFYCRLVSPELFFQLLSPKRPYLNTSMSTVESFFSAHVVGSEYFNSVNKLYGDRSSAEVLRDIK